MKPILLITLLIATAQICAAQKIRFTDTSNHWEELISIYNDGQGGILLQSYHYVQDSTVDSTDYKVFAFGSDWSYPENYFIREDTILNKVYVRDGNSDLVLMDYNLNVGDTFSIAFGGQYNLHRYAVIDLDSILINATWHKVWTYSPNLDAFFPFNNSVVIEGIGCIRHPLYFLQYSGCIECSYFYMYCFSKNGATPLVSPGQPYGGSSTILFDNDTSCTKIPALNVDDLPYSRCGLKLFPNPANTSISITSTNKIAALIIYDMIGRIVYSQKYNSKTAQVDIDSWPKGIYVVRVNDAEVKKFIKE